MQIVKYIMLVLIFISSTIIGKFLSKKYTDRLAELEEMKNALNIFKSKIKFTYEPISEIFQEIAKTTIPNISNIFTKTVEKMENTTARRSLGKNFTWCADKPNKRRYTCIINVI